MTPEQRQRVERLIETIDTRVSHGCEPAKTMADAADVGARRACLAALDAAETVNDALGKAEAKLSALTAPPAPPHDPELREWIGAEWDRLLEDAGLEDSKREQAIEQLAQVFEAHSAAILRSAMPAPHAEAVRVLEAYEHCFTLLKAIVIAYDSDDDMEFLRAERNARKALGFQLADIVDEQINEEVLARNGGVDEVAQLPLPAALRAEGEGGK